MKLSIKRIYCNDCQKLVWGKEQKAKDGTRISCPKCGKLLWVWIGVSWRYGGQSQPATRT